MNFVRDIPSRYILLIIVVLGFILRIINLTIGFPILFVSNDEAIYHLSALNMLAEKTLFTIGNYGPLGAYVQIPFIILAFGMLFLMGKIHSVSDMEILLVTQEGYLLFIPRVISAMFGTLSILIIYILARELFNDKKVGLWASFFFAVSFNMVHISHLARAWSAAIFFSLLAILFSVKSIKKSKNEFRNIILAFSLAAVSFGFHQISGVIIILILLVRFLRTSWKWNILVNRFDLMGFVLFLILVLIFNYFSVGNNFFKIIDYQNPNVGLIKSPIDSLTNGSLQKILKDLILTDGLITLLAGLFFFGLFLDKKQFNFATKKIIIGLFVFIIFNFSMIATILPPFLRYFLIGFSFLPIFAGNQITKVLHFNKRVYLLGIIVISLASFNSVYWNLLILKEPTYDQLRKWVDKNIAVQTPIVATLRRNFSYVPNKKASEPIRAFNSGYYVRATKLVGNNYPYNVRNIIYADQFNEKSKIANVEKAVIYYPSIYIIDWYFASYDRLLTQESKIKFELIAHFSPTDNIVYDTKIPEAFFDAPYNFPFFKVDRTGPYFDVLKVNY